jgi:hypothetical protein
MVINPKNRALRHLQAAEGFLELDLPKLALEELEEITEAGEFQIQALWMTAEALKAEGRFEDAVAPLQHVTQTLPAPMNQEALKSLNECLEKSGRGSVRTTDRSRTVSFKLEPNQSLTISFRKAS